MAVFKYWHSTGATVIMICNMSILGDMTHNIVYGVLYLFMLLVIIAVVLVPALLKKREVDAYCDQLRIYREEVERIRSNSEKHLNGTSDVGRHSQGTRI